MPGVAQQPIVAAAPSPLTIALAQPPIVETPQPTNIIAAHAPITQLTYTVGATPNVAEAVPISTHTPVYTAAPVSQVVSTPYVPSLSPQALAVVHQPVAAPVVAAPAFISSPPVAHQHHAQDEYGQYQYGYTNEDSAKLEQRLADGSVRGTYSYVDANSKCQCPLKMNFSLLLHIINDNKDK